MQNNSKLTFKILDRIDKISPQEWSGIFPNAVEDYYFFKTLDESGLNGFSFFYILVYDSDVLVGATSCFSTRFAFDMMVQGPLKKVLGVLKRIAPNILSPKIIACGLPMGQGRIGIKGDTDKVMAQIYCAMEFIAKKEKANALLFKDFTSSYEQILKPLFRFGFNKTQSIPSTEMAVNFSSFDDYVRTLSQSSREGLRRKLKKIDSLGGIDLEITNSPDEKTLNRIYELYLETLQQQEVNLETLSPDFFRLISVNMPKQTKYFIWRIKDKIVAFALCLVKEDYFLDYYLGFDYSLAYQYHLYFLRFRDLMKWCIDNGIKRYEMGVTAYEPKRRLGFDFVRLYFYIKHRNHLINPFAKVIAHFIKPENFDPVFNEMNKN